MLKCLESSLHYYQVITKPKDLYIVILLTHKMVDLFGKKKKAALEAEKAELEKRLNEAVKINREIGAQYDTLEGKYSALETTSAEKDTKLSELEASLQTATDANKALEVRLTPSPNPDIIKFKAISELASSRSDEGYDAFLKSMITAVVDRGVLAYEDTLQNSLRGKEQRWYQKGEEPFPTIIDQTSRFYVGFSVLNDRTKPQVSIIGADFPYLECYEAGQKKAVETRYGSSDPQIILRFRTEQEARDNYSRKDEEDMLNGLLPAEWQERLEADKDVLIKAFSFGFAASYYEDITANPKLPAVLQNRNHPDQPINVPQRVLGMQERTGLGESQSLLQDLYECVQDQGPKFSAGVVSHFKQQAE